MMDETNPLLYSKVRSEENSSDISIEDSNKEAKNTPQEEKLNWKNFKGLFTNIYHLYSRIPKSVASEIPEIKTNRKWTISFTISLTLIVIIQTFVVSRTGGIIGDFYTVISEGDKEEFVKMLIKGSAVISLSAICFCLVKFFASSVALCWREKLVFILQTRDQRITQDVDKFVSSVSNLVSATLPAPLVVALYGYLCAARIHFSAPLIVCSYFAVGAVGAKMIAKHVVAYAARQEEHEGRFRRLHSFAHRRAESVAIARGERRIRTKTFQRFYELFRTKKRIIGWEFGLDLTSNLFTYLGSIVNYIVIAIPVFLNILSFTPSQVAENSFYCIMLISGFSSFFNVSSQIAEAIGYSNRIKLLIDEMISLSQQNYGKISFSETNSIILASLSLYLPDRTLLMPSFSYSFKEGENCLITGKSGIGKSTLLRTIGGLWPFFDGSIIRPIETEGRQEVLFAPQNPINEPDDTIWGQIIYPYVDIPPPSKEDLAKLLESVGVRRNAEAQTLSRGEQQAIAVLRILFFRPRFAIIDEGTASMDVETERQCYSLLCDNTKDIFGMKRETVITVISVAHRDTIRRFHQKELHFDKNGIQITDI